MAQTTTPSSRRSRVDRDSSPSRSSTTMSPHSPPYTPKPSQDTESDLWESVHESSTSLRNDYNDSDGRYPPPSRPPSAAARAAASRKRRLRPSTRKASSRVSTPISTPRKRMNSLPSSPPGVGDAEGWETVLQTTFAPERERGRIVVEILEEKGQRIQESAKKWEPPQTAVHVRNFVYSTSGGIVQISLEATRTLLWLIKEPLVYLLMGYMFVALLGLVYRHVEDLGKAAWCTQPISRFIGTDMCAARRTYGTGETPPGIDVGNLWSVQERLGTVMEKAGEGVGMARGMKGTEHAIRDLVVLVQNSDIAGKKALSDKLEYFVEGAKRTTRDLSRFTAKVSGVADSIIAMDEYALLTLQALSQPPSFAQRAQKLLLPFNPPNPNASLLKAFSQITTHMSGKLPPLILSAESLLSDLDTLEQTLITVNEMVARDSASLSSSERELLSNLWVRLLGARSKDLANFRSHRELLHSVSEYRSKALELITGTLVELQAIQADLEEFGSRLNEPAFVGDEVPVQVVIEGIRRGIKRLNMGRFEVEGRRRGEWAIQKEIGDK